MTPTVSVLEMVAAERDRQEAKCADKRAEGLPWFTCADERASDALRLSVLGEEFGEVCREVADAIGDGDEPGPNLKTELVQLAAVAVAWVESL